MTANEIRQSFFDFFKSKQHRIVESSSVVPYNDPTLLFTNAGMNQFKDVFLGTGKRDYTRAADTQKCIRVSGKHNDLEEVGVDTYHHTFFEMLGNWSFGDYYKAEAIQWAWELLTEVWGLEKDRLFATVYRSDDESFELWKNYLPESRILRFDEKDNFWEMGETGPCGPCSEIHYDKTSDKSGINLVNADSPDVIEIWNLVFIQYNRNSKGKLEELADKFVDTGMGFERIVAVIQEKDSNYETDIFMPILNEIEQLSNKKYKSNSKDSDSTAMRVIADHIRTLAFSIADGALPSNEGRGYVLRRILRRAARFAKSLGFNEPVLYKLIPKLVEIMGAVFPELNKNITTIQKVIKAEEESFLITLERGLEKFEGFIKILEKNNSNIISGDDAFLLYDTYGFPLDLTELLARERNLQVDVQEFNENMQSQKQRSRDARKVKSQEVEVPVIDVKTEFSGYNNFEDESEILYVKDNQIVVDRTPFYMESGGQVSDIGEIVFQNEIYKVENLQKSGDAIIHICNKKIEANIGDKVLLKVSISRRRDIMRNHSATHLLHEALRQILGNHVKQSGSLVAPDYLRFDFNHFEKVSDKDLKRIESIVNQKIFEQIPVRTDILPIEEAKKNSKIKMFFGDKYGDIVRVVTIDENFSIEFCGGTHVSNTIEIGLFKIVSESSIASGIRRIEAITGRAVEKYIYNLENDFNNQKIHTEELLMKIKKLKKELSDKKLDNVKDSISEWINEAKIFNDIKIVAKKIEAENIDEMRTIGENLRNTLGNKGIGLLISEINNKAQMVCVVTDDLKKEFPAGKLVGKAAKILGGGGGGKPHLATAGGKDISKIPELIDKFEDVISNK